MSAAIKAHDERPAAVWSSGGATYDKISQQISAALEHCVQRLDPLPGERVLDVATWASRLLARRGSKVTGVDFAADLLASAKARAADEQLDIEYWLEDAEKLSFPDTSFDVVVSTFGVMFASRPEAAAAEIARVPQGWPLGPRHLVARPQRIRDVQGNASLHASTASPSAALTIRVGQVGAHSGAIWKHLRSYIRFEQGTCVPYDRNGEVAWEVFVNGYGPTKSLAGSLDETRRADLRRDFVAFHDQFKTELGIAVPRTYLLTVSMRY
jgi:hypothetical protein